MQQTTNYIEQERSLRHPKVAIYVYISGSAVRYALDSFFYSIEHKKEQFNLVRVNQRETERMNTHRTPGHSATNFPIERKNVCVKACVLMAQEFVLLITCIVQAQTGVPMRAAC